MLGRYVLSGWWRRAGAQVIDGIIISVGALVLFLPLVAAGVSVDTDGGYVALVVAGILWILCVAIVALLYAPTMMARTNGKTLGRMATGIRVVRTSGEEITFGFAMLREVAVKTILFGVAGALTGGIAQLVDYLWPLWDEENRCLHDFIVQTRSSKTRETLAQGARFPSGIRPEGETRSGERGAAAGGGLAAGLGPDHLVARGADADERDRHADEVGDEREVVARGLREV